MKDDRLFEIARSLSLRLHERGMERTQMEIVLHTVESLKKHKKSGSYTNVERVLESSLEDEMCFEILLVELS